VAELFKKKILSDIHDFDLKEFKSVGTKTISVIYAYLTGMDFKIPKEKAKRKQFCLFGRSITITITKK
jgi:hypothetical protein